MTCNLLKTLNDHQLVFCNLLRDDLFIEHTIQKPR